MSSDDLLDRLGALGVRLFVADGRLRADAARGVLTEELKQAIAAHKAELLERVAAGSVVAAAPGSAPVAIPRGRPLPLSLFQERLWVISQMEPDATDYNIVTPWHLEAPTQVALERIGRLVQRHEILRTCYRDEGGGVAAWVLPATAVPIEVRHDLELLSAEEQLHRLGQAVDAAKASAFDLTARPPVRFTVFGLGDRGCATVVALHHIAVDTWSIGLLEREFAVADDPSAGVSPRLQYADFAAWQRHGQDRRVEASDRDWWTRRLTGTPALSVFPGDQPPGLRSGGAAFDFEWGAELSLGLRALAREQGATLYMALLAACATVLHRHTGQQDVVFGSPMGSRERPEFESMVGPFVNLLVLRLDLCDNPEFTELLRRARDALLDAHAHRQVPFESLLERLRPARAPNRSPLFQMAMVQHNAPEGPAMPLYGGGSMHDMTWYIRDLGIHVEGTIEYRCELFSAAAIEAISAQVRAVLSAAVLAPQCRIGEVSLISPDTRERLLHQFNPPAVPVDGALFVKQFEHQAAARPHALAVRDNEDALTYAELNRRANQWARHLGSVGIGPGARVALCMHRSLDMLVLLLGIQKTGAAYVPLDPGFPPERLTFMLSDSGASVLVTDAGAAAGVSVPAAVMVVDAQAHAARLQTLAADDVGTAATLADAAYVMYTSGSTGQPKGVVVSHGGLVNFLESMRREPGMAIDDVLAAITTISFDISGLELYLPLLVGARVELVARDTAADGAALAELLEARGVTVLQATPSTWRLLIEAAWKPRPGFRALCGGERLPRDLADALLGRVHELWNLYGPTETTVWSSMDRVAPGPGRITVGKPIANTQIYVLDSAGEPVPPGMRGEICIGGAGVALGYHRRAELTAEKFIADPFSGIPGTRLYRTGDLGQWLPDGRLEHLGRVDHQVKVRGFRIELGEIESLLSSHPAVNQAVVVTWEPAPDDVRLIAYAVLESGQHLAFNEMHTFLARKLPAYMLPSRLIPIERAPLTPNGKVDRRALPAPGSGATAGSRHLVAAQTPGELAMAHIWREILELNDLSVTESFFDLGGHSMLVLRLMTQIEKRFGRKVSLSALIAAPTVRSLTALLEQPDAADSLVLIRPGGPRPPVFFVHDGEGETLLYRDLAQHLDARHPVFGLQPHSSTQHRMLHTRVCDMAAHHIGKIRKVQAHGPYLLAGLCAGGVIAYEIARQLQDAGESVAALALLDVADTQEPTKARLLSSKRRHRFASQFIAKPSWRHALAVLSQIPLAFGKVKNAVLYELGASLERRRVIRQCRLLRRALDSGLPPPKGTEDLSVSQIYMLASREYQAQGVLQGDLASFRATLGNGTEADVPMRHLYADPGFGWQKRVAGIVHVFDVPGGHFSMLQEPHSRVLAARIQAYIDIALAEPPAQQISVDRRSSLPAEAGAGAHRWGEMVVLGVGMTHSLGHLLALLV